MDELEIKLLSILENGNENLINDYIKVEKSFFGQILKYLRDEFSFTKNKLDSNTQNKKKIIATKEYLLEKGNFETNEFAIKNYLQEIDSILDLNKKIIDKKDFNQTFTLEKEILFNDTINRILNKDAFLDNLLPDIKQEIFKSIIFNDTYKALEDQLSKTLEDSTSQRYVKQLSRDSINQFDGAISAKSLELYKFNAFTFNGSLIETSRKSCKGMVKGNGEYAKFVIPNYSRIAYFTKDIPKIIEISKDNDGWNPDTTIDTFPIYRNGFGCRHRISFFMYVE